MILLKPLLFNRLNLDDVYKRGTLISIHIADLHFGVKQISPKTEYDILDEQFFPIIENIYFDILSINLIVNVLLIQKMHNMHLYFFPVVLGDVNR